MNSSENLSELIVMCGDKFYDLSLRDGKWRAESRPSYERDSPDIFYAFMSPPCNSPEEAVRELLRKLKE